jgi:hypothetical protein
VTVRKVDPARPQNDLPEVFGERPGAALPDYPGAGRRLLRYLHNEPISVRPAGAPERGWKWVRRNKVVSISAAAVFLALALGLGYSVGFGIHANEQAEEARKQKKDAEDATEREEREK